MILGWLGSRPAEGGYVLAAQICTAYYFAYFIIILPLLGFIETPKALPVSITDAVLAKNGGHGHPAGATASPDKH